MKARRGISKTRRAKFTRHFYLGRAICKLSSLGQFCRPIFVGYFLVIYRVDFAWIAKFRVLSPIPRFIPKSALYPQFRVLSPIPRFIPDSGSVFRFRIPFPHSCSAFYPYPNFNFNSTYLYSQEKKSEVSHLSAPRKQTTWQNFCFSHPRLKALNLAKKQPKAYL